jgi:hypothetical protein
MNHKDLQTVLDALLPISHNSTDDPRGQADKAISILKAELDKPDEPVAWGSSDGYWILSEDKELRPDKAFYKIAFYTCPQSCEHLEQENLSLKKLLRVIAYPHRGTNEETMDIFQAASLIQAAYTSEELEGLGHCKTCDVEKQCGYPYKPCDCFDFRKYRPIAAPTAEIIERNKMKLCKICGEPMPAGEQMFHYHGYSCPCPKPPLKREPEYDPAGAPKLELTELERAALAVLNTIKAAADGGLIKLSTNMWIDIDAVLAMATVRRVGVK